MDQPFTERRLRFMDAIGEGLAVVPGAQEIMRNADTNHDFRQASDFFFLTGFDEPDAVAVFNPTHVKERYVLFVRPRDREMEIWNGYRAGIEGAVARYGADAAYSIDELDQKLRDYGLDRPVLYYRLGNPAFDPRITRLVGELRAARARGYTPPTRLEDPSPILNELRLRKLPEELARLRRACEISAEAHTEAMRFTHPGLMEYQVQAVLEYVFRMNGSRRNAYPSIVGSGPNACILHYLENNRRMEDGDLLLIDAGCEYGYQASDITRTFPVNGRFTAPQRAIYDIVLRAQLAGIAAAKPGQRYEVVHDAARRVLTEGLVALRLLPLGVEESLAMHHYREFYMHGTGHWTCTTSAITGFAAGRAISSPAWCSPSSPASISTRPASRPPSTCASSVSRRCSSAACGWARPPPGGWTKKRRPRRKRSSTRSRASSAASA